MGSRLRLIGRMAISIILLMGLLASCTSSKSASPEPTTSTIDFSLDIGFVAWWGRGEGPSSCAQGLVAADFLQDGASVRVYNEDNGDLLASGRLTVSSNDNGNCYYTSERLKVPRVDFYRTVIDGRRTYISSFVDLKVAADEFRSKSVGDISDLWLVREYGWY